MDKRIAVIATGGTISGLAENESSFLLYKGGRIPIEDMLSSLPGLERYGEVSGVNFGCAVSSAYSERELCELSLLVDKTLETFDGVVVTCGTDTLEEIAYFLDLTVRSSKPLVITAAMRPWNVISSDGPANLFNAIKLASSGKTARFGAVAALNEEIHAARDVTKINPQRTAAFASPLVGMLGYIDQDFIVIRRKPRRAYLPDDEWQTPFELKKLDLDKLARVGIAPSYQSASADVIEALAAAGFDGIVTMGTGTGNLTPAQKQARESAVAKGIIFMAATRTGSGACYYSREGVVPADSLNAWHARIFLQLALSFSHDYPTVKEWASRYAAGWRE